jgi:hypothetical protein
MTVVRRFATKASNANSAFAAHQKCFNRVQSLKKTGCQLKLMQLIRHMVEPVFLCRTGCLGGSFSTLLYLRQGRVSLLGAASCNVAQVFWLVHFLAAAGAGLPHSVGQTAVTFP